MSATLWPPISPDELKKEEKASLARELAWLLDSLQETLPSLKSGLEECYALLAPIEPGSTLVISSPRSEAVKGYVTRVGTRVVKGSLNLRLRTHNALNLTLNPDHPILLQPLITLRNLLDQALDCVDITRWTGDRHSASFISSQLRLLHSIVTEAYYLLKGPTATTVDENWTLEPLDPSSFEPPLPPGLNLDLSVQDASIILVVRTLEAADAVPDLKSRFAYAIGAQRRLEHDEQDKDFTYMSQTVKVREKVRVESADPSLMAAMAKLGALDHSIFMSRNCLSMVMGEEIEDNEQS